MDGGEPGKDPIVNAIAIAEKGTTAEIRVHVSRRFWEFNPRGRALSLFNLFGMSNTRQRNAVLLYFNLSRHRFAIIGDQGLETAVETQYWKKLSRDLTENLRSTDPERAIAQSIHLLGEKLRKHFPKEIS